MDRNVLVISEDSVNIENKLLPPSPSRKKNPPVPVHCDLLGSDGGGGDDSGNFSESTTKAMASREDPGKLIHTFLNGVNGNSTNPILASGSGNSGASSNTSPRCEEESYKADADCTDQSDTYPDQSALNSSSNPINSDSYLTTLASNFNRLYEGKLAELEGRGRGETETIPEGEVESLRLKNALLRSWLHDLHEQNSLLISALEEMEREAEQKIEVLQRKMQASQQITDSHMLMIAEYERQVQKLLNQRVEDGKSREELRARFEELKDKCGQLQGKLQLRAKSEEDDDDRESLLTLVARIRDLGLWDTTGLKLGRRSRERLFGLYPGLEGSEVQTVFTREKAKKAMDATRQLEELTIKFKDLGDYKKQFDEILTEKDRSIASLEQENCGLKSLSSALQQQLNISQSELDESRAKLDTQLLANNVLLRKSSAEETSSRLLTAEKDVLILRAINLLATLEQEYSEFERDNDGDEEKAEVEAVSRTLTPAQ